MSTRAVKQGKIVAEVYLEWAMEQAGTFKPAAEWSGSVDQPSAYHEHPEALSASPEAIEDLHERTQNALKAAGLVKQPLGLTASSTAPERPTRG